MKIRNFKLPLGYVIGTISLMSANVVSDPITMDAVIIGKDVSSICDMSAVCNDDTFLNAYTCASVSSKSLRPLFGSISDALSSGVKAGVGVSYCFRSCGSRIIKADLKRVYVKPCKNGIMRNDSYMTDAFVGMGVTDCFSCCGAGGLVNSIMLCASYQKGQDTVLDIDAGNTAEKKYNNISILLMISGYNCCSYKNFIEVHGLVGPSRRSSDTRITNTNPVVIIVPDEDKSDVSENPDKSVNTDESESPVKLNADMPKISVEAGGIVMMRSREMSVKIGFGVGAARRIMDGYCVFVDLDMDGVFAFNSNAYVPSFREGSVEAKFGLMYAL